MLFSLTYSDLKYVHQVTRSEIRGDRKLSPLFKIFFLVRGRAEVTAQGQQLACGAGELVLIGQNQDFVVTPTDTEAEYYLMYFTEYILPGEITTVLRYSGGSFPVMDSPLPHLFRRFDEHLSYVGQEEKMQIKMLFRCVLTEILIYFSKILEHEMAVPGMMNGNMEPVLNFISRNLERPLQIQDICAEFHYSRSHLCKVFSQVTGVPLMQYIRTARAQYAEKLLLTGIPAMEVARQLGYSDYSAFYRMYRKYANCAPSSTIQETEKIESDG